MDEMEHDRRGRIARMTITAKIDRKVERNMAEETCRRGNIGKLEREPRPPIIDDHIGIDQGRLDVTRQRLALARRQIGREIRNHHVKAGQHGMFCRNAMRCAASAAALDIADTDDVAALAHIDRGRLQADADFVVGAIERAVVEPGEYDVVHGVAGCGVGNKRAHQQPYQRRLPSGK